VLSPTPVEGTGRRRHRCICIATGAMHAIR
jgi:hypothetical protein